MEATIPNNSLLARLLTSLPAPQLRTLRREIVTDLHTAEQTALRLSRELADIDRELATRGDEVPPSPPRRRPAVPLKKAIRLVLRERTDLLADELMNELERRSMEPGGNNPRNTLISRLAEMQRDGEVSRRDGRYSLTSRDGQARLNEEEVPAM